MEILVSIFITHHLWFEVWYFCSRQQLDLPSLESINLGAESFRNSLTTIIDSILCLGKYLFLDLPSLHSLTLGEESLLGVSNDTSCSLTMRSSHID